MHRRDAAQGGEAQIRLRRQRRSADEGFGRVVHIRDEAEPLALVEGAGLHRDIGGGVAQAEKGGQTGPQRLGHDLAARVGQELVDHHPVETRHGPHLMSRRQYRGGSMVLEILGMSLDAGGHLTHGAKAAMSGKWFDAVQYGVDRETHLIDYDEVERLVDEVLARPPEEAARIGRNSADHPARKRTQDQAAVGLDGPRHVDPLTLARRQVGHGRQGRSNGPFAEIHDVRST